MRLVVALCCLVPTAATAQDTLRIRFATERADQTGHLCFYDLNLADGLNNQNRNIVAVWLEEATTGAYMRTIYRWGRTYTYNLEDWAQASHLVVDSVTSASERCFSGETCGTGSNQVTAAARLDTGAIDISSIPDGDYRVRIEMSSCEVADEYRSGSSAWETPDISFSFTKARASQANISVADDFPFNTITLDYVAGANSAPGISAGGDQRIYPVTNQAIAHLSAVASGAVSVAWTFTSVEPAGGAATFTDANAMSTDVSFSASGIYTLRATATNAQSLTSFDEVTIIVNGHVLIPDADAEVSSGDPNRNLGVLALIRPPNNGPWLYSWGPQNAPPCNGNASDQSRGYMRFDVGAVVSGSIDLARMRLPVAEQRPETTKYHDYFVLSDAQDDWVANQADDEATITWNNQPLPAGDVTNIGSQLIAAYQHRTDFNTVVDLPLDLAVIGANDQNRIWTLFITPRGRCNGMGTAARENTVNPELLVIEHWQSNPNLAPNAIASAPSLVVDANGDGIETVALNGGSSSDDLGIVLYEWTAGSVLATTQNANVPLGLGAHAIELRVVDGAGLEDRDTLRIVVDDRYTPNSMSSVAAAIDSRSYDNLFVAVAQPDYYSLDLAGGGDLRIDLRITSGSVNAVLLASDASTELARSASSVTASGLAPGLYYLRVEAVADAVYAFDVSISGASLAVALNPVEAAESSGILRGAGSVALNMASMSAVSIALTSSDPARLRVPVASVMIPAGALSGSFDVELIDNAIADGDVSLTLRATALGYNAASASFLVIDDDAVGGSIVRFEIESATVQETMSPLMILKAVLDAPALVDVVVPFTIGGTATVGADYRDDAGTLGRGTVTIVAGSISASVIFSIADDDLSEATETLILTMSTPTGAVAGRPNIYTLNIEDNDAPPDPGSIDPGLSPTTRRDELRGSCGCGTASPRTSGRALMLLLIGLGVLGRRFRRDLALNARIGGVVSRLLARRTCESRRSSRSSRLL